VQLAHVETQAVHCPISFLYEPVGQNKHPLFPQVMSGMHFPPVRVKLAEH
jgi:hypothetical protein